MDRRILSLIVAILFIVVAASGCVEEPPVEKEGEVCDDGIYRVIRVVDGDTILVSGGDRIRMIGINTPEYGEPYSQLATDHLIFLIEGKNVTLEGDCEDKDGYGRLLRYVFLNETNINVEMVKIGLALSYPYGDTLKYYDEIELAEDTARSAGAGLWTPSQYSFSVLQAHYDASGSDSSNLNDEFMTFRNDENDTMNMTGWVVKEEGSRSYTFPSFSLEPGRTVTLYSGTGNDTTDKLYWGLTWSVWNNDRDRVFLRDELGHLAAYAEWDNEV